MKIKHMKVEWVDVEHGVEDDYRLTYEPNFRGHVATMVNSLESIIADCTLAAGRLGGLIWLAKASQCLKRFGLKLLAVQRSERHTTAHLVDSRSELIEFINKGLGVTGRLERVGFVDCPDIWFWEGNNGAILSTKNLDQPLVNKCDGYQGSLSLSAQLP